MAKLKKRSDGRYQASVYIGRDDEGKRRYKTVYGKTQKEVNAKAAEIKIRVGKGMDLLNGEITWGELCHRWEVYKRPLLREQQLGDYLTALKPFEPLNGQKISKLIKSDFQEIVSEYAERNPKTGKPTSRRTLSGYRMAARQVMEYAVENRIVDYNPVDYVKIPAESPKKERRALTEEEQQWIINTPHRAQLPAMLMMLAGLRLGECLALQWRDIDLAAAEIHVHQKLLYKQKPPKVVPGAKSEKGIRAVNVPRLLVSYLKQQPPHEPGDYVCRNAHGQIYSATAWREVWDSYMLTLNAKYGDFTLYEKKYKSKFDPEGVPFVIERFTAHYLRHTCATNLFHCGKNVLYVQDQLGHAKPETTMNIYTHLVKSGGVSKNRVISIDKYLDRLAKIN